MSRMWEIRESYGEKRKRTSADEAYECGYEEGYEAAMAEMKESEEESDSARSYRMGARKSGRYETRR